MIDDREIRDFPWRVQITPGRRLNASSFSCLNLHPRPIVDAMICSIERVRVMSIPSRSVWLPFHFPVTIFVAFEVSIGW